MAKGREDWYDGHAKKFAGLLDVVSHTLKSLLEANLIDYFSVSGRIKTKKSFIDKLDKKEYGKYEDMTDLCGLRIISFVESDMKSICNIVEKSFKVIKDKSLDKSEELEEDKVGYRSIHYICELGDKREALPELARYKGMQFEIQVRTVLQHAWAEIEHDRNYKLSGVLPKEIKRRLFLLSGTLELVDAEFSRIASDVDKYIDEVKRKTGVGDLKVEITSIGLKEYLEIRLNKLGITSIPDMKILNVDIIEELNDFGINTVEDLDKMFSDDDVMKAGIKKTYSGIGFLRALMMLTDPNRYFDNSWKSKWNFMSPSTYDLLKEKIGDDAMKILINKYKIKIAQRIKLRGNRRLRIKK